MYAIVEVAGKQYKISEGDILNVDKLNVETNETVFDKVLLLVKDNDIKVGTPVLNNVKVTAEVVDKIVKGDKKVVYKFKRRKNFRRKKGHRQKFTKIKIKKIEVVELN